MLLVYFAAAWLAGITVAAQTSLPLVAWACWLVLPAGLLLIWWRDPVLRRWHAYGLIFILAALRYTAALPVFDEHSLASLNDRGPVLLSGTVSEPPEIRDRAARIHFSVSRARVDNSWRDLSGRALVQLPRDTDVRYGDQIEILAEPTTPFEAPDFSYKDYLARQGIHSTIYYYGRVNVLARGQGDPMHTALYAFRERALETLRVQFPEPAAALLSGILFGDDAGLPADLQESFSNTNTAHIIAISGFNVTMIAGVLLAFTRRLKSRFMTTVLVIFGLVAYTLLVGAGASVVRAAIMGILSVLAVYFYRQNTGLNALAFAALVMTVQNPLIAADLSFQLSFFGTLGLVLYVGSIEGWLERNLLGRVGSNPLRQIFAYGTDLFVITIAAEVTTLPLIAFAFGRLAVVGQVTNLMILPAQPAIMILGGFAVAIGTVFSPLGQLLAWIAWPFLQWTILVVQGMGNLKFAALEIGRFDVWWLVLWYLVLFGATLVDWRSLRLPRAPSTTPVASSASPTFPPAGPSWPASYTRNSPFPSSSAPLATIPPWLALSVGVAIVGIIWIWNLSVALPDGNTHVEFIDAGAPATFVRTPGGGRILIDGGANPSAVLSALGEHTPFWDHSLDLVVLTEPGSPNVSALIPVLERYTVRQVVQPQAPSRPNATFAKWSSVVAERSIPNQWIEADTQLVLDNVTLDLLGATESGAVIAQLRAGRVSILFVGSNTEEEQRELARAGFAFPSTVLVSPRRLDPMLVEMVDPQIVISFESDPTRGTLVSEYPPALADRTVLRMDRHGMIELIVGEQDLQISKPR